MPDIPNQGYGPHFEIGDDGVITFAPPQSLDCEGNNVALLTRLHPSLRGLSEKLVDALGQGNIPHFQLRERAKAYQEVIDQDIQSVDFSQMYVEGVRLANARKAAAGDDRLPPLKSNPQEALDSLLQLHGPFLLATAHGIEALAKEERYNRTPQEEIEYRAAALESVRDHDVF
jgi:hypothetical protein